eukprot:CAMPEP_0172323460 /NCGR_PEP_ID=MMETSP1058-20130122/48785_1 /TAXON_ID=83371 /ORGANISM="Detonula confervacea, Strain CCMP 353" /LENGTH=258 /DNA_ID=CAMNT_0013039457 /DNA_START=49 /DNA_END=825 /DNA_ORIENTATION=+
MSLTSRRIAVLLLLSLQLASATKSSSLSSLAAPTRLAFYPRGGASSSSTSTLVARRRKSTTTQSTIQTVGSKWKTTRDFEEEYDYNPQSRNKEPSLDELRDELGPIGSMVANTVELTVTTLGSYISGGFLGYMGGGVMGIPSILFAKEMGSIPQRFSALNSKAFASCKSWATLSAAFSGFQNLVRVCRGGVDDSWNSIWGSAMAGAFLNRAGGPQAMLQSGATYAGFTYCMDKFFASPSSRQAQQSSEFMYTDVPIED